LHTSLLKRGEAPQKFVLHELKPATPTKKDQSKNAQYAFYGDNSTKSSIYLAKTTITQDLF
jgi:hypothetical protein